MAAETRVWRSTTHARESPPQNPGRALPSAVRTWQSPVPPRPAGARRAHSQARPRGHAEQQAHSCCWTTRSRFPPHLRCRRRRATQAAWLLGPRSRRGGARRTSPHAWHRPASGRADATRGLVLERQSSRLRLSWRAAQRRPAASHVPQTARRPPRPRIRAPIAAAPALPADLHTAARTASGPVGWNRGHGAAHARCRGKPSSRRRAGFTQWTRAGTRSARSSTESTRG